MAASSSTADDQVDERSIRIRSGKKDHVKRPMNAFMIWGRAERRRLAAENPTASNGDLSRILGQRWNAMSDDEKQPFMAEGERLRSEHRRQYPHYKYRPRPPRRRLVAIPGHQQECSASLYGPNTSLAHIEDHGSSQLLSTLQQCSVSELLNALASKVTSPSHHHESSESTAVLKKVSCFDGCLDKTLDLDSFTSQLNNPLNDDVSLADTNLSQLGNEEHPSLHGDEASNPRTIDQASEQWEYGKLAVPCESLSGNSVASTACYGYSQPNTFWTASSPADDHRINQQKDLHGQSSTLAALAHPSLSCASLANDSSMDTWSKSYEYIPSTYVSSATGAAGTTQAVTFTSAGPLLPHYYLPFTGSS